MHREILICSLTVKLYNTAYRQLSEGFNGIMDQKKVFAFTVQCLSKHTWLLDTVSVTDIGDSKEHTALL